MDGKREIIEEALEGWNPEALFFDGLDEALVGYATQQYKPPLVVYSYLKIVSVLMTDGATHEEAVEHISFNIEGAWVGENTPLILHEIEDE